MCKIKSQIITKSLNLFETIQKFFKTDYEIDIKDLATDLISI